MFGDDRFLELSIFLRFPLFGDVRCLEMYFNGSFPLTLMWLLVKFLSNFLISILFRCLLIKNKLLLL